MNEERLSILRMVKEGKIAPEEGVELLEALKGLPEGEAVKEEKKPRYFRVLVREDGGRKSKVNVSIPLSLVKLGLKLAGPQATKFIPDRFGISELSEEARKEILDEIIAAIDSGELGKIVEVDEENSHVEIYLE